MVNQGETVPRGTGQINEVVIAGSCLILPRYASGYTFRTQKSSPCPSLKRKTWRKESGDRGMAALYMELVAGRKI